MIAYLIIAVQMFVGLLSFSPQVHALNNPQTTTSYTSSIKNISFDKTHKVFIVAQLASSKNNNNVNKAAQSAASGIVNGNISTSGNSSGTTSCLSFMNINLGACVTSILSSLLSTLVSAIFINGQLGNLLNTILFGSNFNTFLQPIGATPSGLWNATIPLAIVLLFLAGTFRLVKRSFSNQMINMTEIFDTILRTVIGVTLLGPASGIVINIITTLWTNCGIVAAIISHSITGTTAQNTISHITNLTGTFNSNISALSTINNGLIILLIIGVILMVLGAGFIYIGFLATMRIVYVIFSFLLFPVAIAIGVYDINNRFVVFARSLFISSLLIPLAVGPIFTLGLKLGEGGLSMAVNQMKNLSNPSFNPMSYYIGLFESPIIIGISLWLAGHLLRTITENPTNHHNWRSILTGFAEGVGISTVTRGLQTSSLMQRAGRQNLNTNNNSNENTASTSSSMLTDSTTKPVTTDVRGYGIDSVSMHNFAETSGGKYGGDVMTLRNTLINSAQNSPSFRSAIDASFHGTNAANATVESKIDFLLANEQLPISQTIINSAMESGVADGISSGQVGTIDLGPNLSLIQTKIRSNRTENHNWDNTVNQSFKAV